MLPEKTTLHVLKILPEYYEAVLSSKKTFEIRKNDRDFKVGDTLLLKEWNEHEGRFTDRQLHCEITYILEGTEETERFGLKNGFCVMSIVLAIAPRWRGES